MKINGGGNGWFTRKKSIHSIRSIRSDLISDNIIYLDVVKRKNAFQCIFLPPYREMPRQICNRINEVYKALKNRKVFTSCSFNDRIKKRIDQIQEYANNYNINTSDEASFNDLCDKLLEIQVYILVCRNQWNNRFAALTIVEDVIGNVIK